MVKRLMIIQFGIWLACLIGIKWMGLNFIGVLWEHCRLSPHWLLPNGIFDGEIWQLFTYMWLHDLMDPMHLLFNLVLLYFFGPVFEQRWGPKAFFQFFVLCGIGAALFTVILAMLIPSLFAHPVIGSSGALLGLLSAFAVTFREQKIYIWFVLPISAKHIIPITIGLDFLFFLTFEVFAEIALVRVK